MNVGDGLPYSDVGMGGGWRVGAAGGRDMFAVFAVARGGVTSMMDRKVLGIYVCAREGEWE